MNEEIYPQLLGEGKEKGENGSWRDLLSYITFVNVNNADT